MDFNKVAGQKENKESRKAGPGLLPGALVIQSMDVIKGLAKADEVKKALDQSMEAVKAIQVTDQTSAARCIDLASGAKKAAKAIDAALKVIIQDPEQRIKEARGFAKIFTDLAQVIEIEAKNKVSSWQMQERIRLQDEENERRKKVDELNKKMAAEAKKIGMDEADIPKVEMPTASTTPAVIRTEGGAKSTTAMVWTFEITDQNIVPSSFKTIDERKIRDAIRLGVREIEGIRIFQKEQIRI